MVTRKVKNKSHASARKPSPKQNTCFVIMPFGGWFDEYYSSIYCPAIEAAGLTPTRADDLYRPSTIIHDVWDYTKAASAVLADLTGRNPNVFYELGLAHALAKPAVLVTETIEDVPFDLRALRVIEFNKSAPDWGDRLRAKIEYSLREIHASPLESVLPAFLNVKGSQTTPAVTPHEKEVLELKQDIELLKREVRSGQPGSSVPGITREVADTLIAEYFAAQLPDNIISDLLRARGVGGNYVRHRLARLRGSEDTPVGKAGATIISGSTA